jgi:peptidoglycan hydrolase CwlO-like protein
MLPADRATPNFRARRLALGVALLLLAGVCALALSSGAPAQEATSEVEGKLDELESNIDRQGGLQAEIDRQNARINDLIAQESELRRKADAVQAELDERQAELDEATAQLEAEKAHLAEVRARLNRAIDSLEQLLIDIYKSNDPDTLSVVMQADSWEDLVTQTEYLDRIQNYDEAVVRRVTGLREEIEAAVLLLRDTRERIVVARDEVAARRAELAQAQAEIDSRHSELVSARSERQGTLAALQSREKDLEEDLGTSIPGPGERATLVGQTAIAPPNAPLVVKAVIEAANRISDKPYIWGGGHGSFEDDGYDCSGAVSYALNGGGLLDSPMDSTGFTVYGEPGAGNWITTYAYSGHMYAVIAGLRFDTGGTGGGNGPRWSTVMRETSGFTARHPSGF